MRKQRSILEYYKNFDGIVVSLTDTDIADLIHAFVYSLKLHIRPIVKV